MPVEVILPKVDMDMETGLLAVWHAAPGDQVEKGAGLFDIETDKAAMEVEAPASGVLAHVIAERGARVPVGQVVAWIYAAGEDIPDAPPATAATEPQLQAPAPVAPKPAPVAEATTDPTLRPRATPAARAAARAAGIDLAQIIGSGPHGRIHADDIRPQQPTDAPLSWTEPHRPLAVTRRKGRGAGAPILLIHGFAADAAGWVPLEKALGDAQEIIRIDLPSHGRSPRLRIASFRDLARLVVDAIDDLGAEQLHLVGHSLGGAVATAVADIRPRRIASLTLIAPAGLGPDIDGAALMGIARASRTESLAPWLRQLAADPGFVSDDFARAAMSSRKDQNLRAAQVDLAGMLFPDGTQGFDLIAAIGRVTAPLKIIWGRQDRILPWRHALHAPDAAGLHLLDNAGHIPHMERPDAVARALAENIRTAESAARQR